MSEELNPTAETAVETPVAPVEEVDSEATESTELTPDTPTEETAETTTEEESDDAEADSSEPAEPAVYTQIAIGSPIIINRFGYDIYIVNPKDEFTLNNLIDSGKTMGSIVSNACVPNDQHDEVIIAVRN